MANFWLSLSIKTDVGQQKAIVYFRSDRQTAAADSADKSVSKGNKRTTDARNSVGYSLTDWA